MNTRLWSLGLTALIAVYGFSSRAHAEVTIFEQNDWKVGLGGFIEFDTMYDTTRSYVETVGNGAVARKATYNGDNGRTQFSMRNSRFSFNVQAPVVDGWKTRGYFEMDFLGYDPGPAAAAPSNSESAFYSNPTLRMRHAYLMAENNGWQILVGQNWSLFGWQPQYVLSSISVNPVSGSSYQRTQRMGVVKTLGMNESNDLQLGFSAERPSQRDGKIPNLVLAARWAMNSRKGGFTGPNSDIKAVPMSVGLSGTYRNFKMASAGGSNTYDNANMSAFAIAANALVPIIASSDGKDVSNTLTASGEFTAGQGYGDEFPNWSGGLSQTFTPATGAGTATTNTNLDAGLGGYNGTNGFELLKLRTWDAQLQYHLDGKCFATLGYGQIYSSNIGNFQTAAQVGTATGFYDRVESEFVNFGHDFTSHVRVAVEYDRFATHYVSDGGTNFDSRYMLATYFRL